MTAFFMLGTVSNQNLFSDKGSRNKQQISLTTANSEVSKFDSSCKPAVNSNANLFYAWQLKNYLPA
jgi:hypothetical protein